MDSSKVRTLEAGYTAAVEEVEEDREDLRSEILERIALVPEAVDADHTETGVGVALGSSASSAVEIKEHRFHSLGLTGRGFASVHSNIRRVTK
jgi:hypothetical protein